ERGEYLVAPKWHPVASSWQGARRRGRRAGSFGTTRRSPSYRREPCARMLQGGLATRAAYSTFFSAAATISWVRADVGDAAVKAERAERAGAGASSVGSRFFR